MIYSSHFFEHLSYGDAVALLRECRRTLQPGGVFRAALPNFKGDFEPYLRGDAGYFHLLDVFELLPRVKLGTKTLVDYINYSVYQSGEHKWIMDEEKMLVLLKHVGFNSVAIMTGRPDSSGELWKTARRRVTYGGGYTVPIPWALMGNVSSAAYWVKTRMASLVVV